MLFAWQRRVSAGVISGRGQYSLVNTVPHHKIIMFDIFEEFESFLRWGTLFTEGCPNIVYVMFIGSGLMRWVSFYSF